LHTPQNVCQVLIPHIPRHIVAACELWAHPP